MWLFKAEDKLTTPPVSAGNIKTSDATLSGKSCDSVSHRSVRDCSSRVDRAISLADPLMPPTLAAPDV